MLDGMDLFNAHPREKLSWLDTAEPGSLMMSVLLSIDASRLDSEDAVDYVRTHDRLASWWASLQIEPIIAAAGADPHIDEFSVLDRRPDHDEERLLRIEGAAREELAAATRWSLGKTHSRIESARLLNGPLRRTLESMQLGEISPSHVSIIIEAAVRLPGRTGETPADSREFFAACDALQDRVLRHARNGSLAATRRATRRAVLAIDAAGGERRRREAARCTRSVYVSDGDDGMSTIVARMATETAHAVMAVIDDAAHGDKSVGLTIDERAPTRSARWYFVPATHPRRPARSPSGLT